MDNTNNLTEPLEINHSKKLFELNANTGSSKNSSVEYVGKICADIFSLLENMKQVHGMVDNTIVKQQHLCRIIPEHLRKGTIKIAVVGAIKSGKSTFINSLFNNDILKRGAGVTTSVITRLKIGDTLKARVIFKSWDEINNEIETALKLIPVQSTQISLQDNNSRSYQPSFLSDSLSENFGKGFDLRRKKDRNFLKTVKTSVSAKYMLRHTAQFYQTKSDCDASKYENEKDFAEKGLMPESILISNALDGYEEVKGFIKSDPSYDPSYDPICDPICDLSYDSSYDPSSDSCSNQYNESFLYNNLNLTYDYNSSLSDFSCVEFTGEHFHEHKRFTAISSNAFFVKDVVIEVPVSEAKDNFANFSLFDKFIEIVDCQGSDSTDSSQLSHIQDYLLSANMIVYVISSRTGLREADVKFLSIIREMGILNNIFFIINTDFNEHYCINSLLELEKSVKDGLSYFVENPSVYTISCLFNLFTALETNLNDKDISRLLLWQKDVELVEYSTKSSEELKNALIKKIEAERFSLLIENHIERLRIIANSAKQRILLFTNLLSNDLEKETETIANLKLLQERSNQFESSVDDYIATTLDKINVEINSSINRFFDKNHGIPAISVKEFIAKASIFNDGYIDIIASEGFNHALYTMFHNFRRELDAFMTQNVNPAVIGFIHDQESYIEKAFQTLYQNCYISPSKICCSLTYDNSSPEEINSQNIKVVDLNGSKRILGLSLPTNSFATAYSSKIRADAMARLNFYWLINFIGRFISQVTPSQPESRALKESAKKIKKESLRAVMIHFDAYKHHVKNLYFLPLVYAIARDLKEKMTDMFHTCEIESEKIERFVADDRTNKSEQLEHLNMISSETEDIINRISYVEKNHFRWSNRC